MQQHWQPNVTISQFKFSHCQYFNLNICAQFRFYKMMKERLSCIYVQYWRTWYPYDSYWLGRTFRCIYIRFPRVCTCMAVKWIPFWESWFNKKWQQNLSRIGSRVTFLYRLFTFIFYLIFYCTLGNCFSGSGIIRKLLVCQCPYWL